MFDVTNNIKLINKIFLIYVVIDLKLRMHNDIFINITRYDLFELFKTGGYNFLSLFYEFCFSDSRVIDKMTSALFLF